MKHAVGIDPSLTGCGVVVIAPDGGHVATTCRSRNYGDAFDKRDHRYIGLVADVLDFIDQSLGDDGTVGAICIENYAFSPKSTNNLTKLAEFGGLLRSDICASWPGSVKAEPAISTLKKFITGSGRGEKVAVVRHTISKWKVGFDSEDEYFAFGLALMAASQIGIYQPATDYEATAIQVAFGLDEPAIATHRKKIGTAPTQPSFPF